MTVCTEENPVVALCYGAAVIIGYDLSEVIQDSTTFLISGK